MTTSRDQLKAKLERMRDKSGKAWANQYYPNSRQYEVIGTNGHAGYEAGFDTASEMLIEAMEALKFIEDCGRCGPCKTLAGQTLAKIMAKVEE